MSVHVGVLKVSYIMDPLLDVCVGESIMDPYVCVWVLIENKCTRLWVLY